MGPSDKSDKLLSVEKLATDEYTVICLCGKQLSTVISSPKISQNI